MSVNNEKKNSALVPRPSSAVEKFEPGAKRVLALMVSDTLAIAQRHLAPAVTSPTKAELENWYQQGEMHFCGNGVPENYREAVGWFRKAAEQGHIGAQYILGTCYYVGKGAPQDYTEAVKWLRKAAEQGHASGQNNLGWCYGKGEGVPQDYVEAVKWYRKAAEQGNAWAQHSLGVCYKNGEGIQQDYVEAYKWFRLSAEQGNKEAAEAVVSIGALLSPEQFQEGERRYNEFKVGHKIGFVPMNTTSKTQTYRHPNPEREAYCQELRARPAGLWEKMPATTSMPSIVSRRKESRPKT